MFSQKTLLNIWLKPSRPQNIYEFKIINSNYIVTFHKMKVFAQSRPVVKCTSIPFNCGRLTLIKL